MKRIIILNLIMGVLFVQACKVDNYAMPNMVLEGKVVDAVTGDNIQTRQPDGIKIRLLEDKYTNAVPIDFWSKSDGSFRNAKLFSGKYKVIATEGPFEQSSVDTLVVVLDKNQK